MIIESSSPTKAINSFEYLCWLTLIPLLEVEAEKISEITEIFHLKIWMYKLLKLLNTKFVDPHNNYIIHINKKNNDTNN